MGANINNFHFLRFPSVYIQKENTIIKINWVRNTHFNVAL